MTQPLTALCDHCGKITDVLFNERLHPNKIKETYFKCEHCFYQYTSFVTDAWVRKIQRQLRQMGTSRRTDRTKLHNDINERMSQLKHNLIQFGRADL